MKQYIKILIFSIGISLLNSCHSLKHFKQTEYLVPISVQLSTTVSTGNLDLFTNNLSLNADLASQFDIRIKLIKQGEILKIGSIYIKDEKEIYAFEESAIKIVLNKLKTFNKTGKDWNNHWEYSNLKWKNVTAKLTVVAILTKYWKKCEDKKNCYKPYYKLRVILNDSSVDATYQYSLKSIITDAKTTEPQMSNAGVAILLRNPQNSSKREFHIFVEGQCRRSNGEPDSTEVRYMKTLKVDKHL